jgi:tRNA (mo5U34)-methyltransferase
MNVDQLRDRIEACKPWQYPFELRGVPVPVDARLTALHRRRERYFFRPLLDLFGGSLAGKRVLDLGCNAGFWSLKAIAAGCDLVVGVDGRPRHIDQANLVFGTLDVPSERYRFVTADVEEVDLATLGGFDIVLCLGVMHHLRHPMRFFDAIASINDELLLVDCYVSPIPGTCFELRTEDPSGPTKALTTLPVLVPTKAAVVATLEPLGYTVGMLRPDRSAGAPKGIGRSRYRRTFFCWKGEAVDPSDLDLEPMGGWGSVVDTGLWVSRSILRLGRTPRRKLAVARDHNGPDATLGAP